MADLSLLIGTIRTTDGHWGKRRNVRSGSRRDFLSLPTKQNEKEGSEWERKKKHLVTTCVLSRCFNLVITHTHISLYKCSIPFELTCCSVLESFSFEDLIAHNENNRRQKNKWNIWKNDRWLCLSVISLPMLVTDFLLCCYTWSYLVFFPACYRYLMIRVSYMYTTFIMSRSFSF
jgi:hypothetical protein